MAERIALKQLVRFLDNSSHVDVLAGDCFLQEFVPYVTTLCSNTPGGSEASVQKYAERLLHCGRVLHHVALCPANIKLLKWEPMQFGVQLAFSFLGRALWIFQMPEQLRLLAQLAHQVLSVAPHDLPSWSSLDLVQPTSERKFLLSVYSLSSDMKLLCEQELVRSDSEDSESPKVLLPDLGVRDETPCCLVLRSVEAATAGQVVAFSLCGVSKAYLRVCRPSEAALAALQPLGFDMQPRAARLPSTDKITSSGASSSRGPSLGAAGGKGSKVPSWVMRTAIAAGVLGVVGAALYLWRSNNE